MVTKGKDVNKKSNSQFHFLINIVSTKQPYRHIHAQHEAFQTQTMRLVNNLVRIGKKKIKKNKQREMHHNKSANSFASNQISIKRGKKMHSNSLVYNPFSQKNLICKPGHKKQPNIYIFNSKSSLIYCLFFMHLLMSLFQSLTTNINKSIQLNVKCKKIVTFFIPSNISFLSYRLLVYD